MATVRKKSAKTRQRASKILDKAISAVSSHEVKIPPPNIQTVMIPIRGTTIYVGNRMPKIAFDDMRANMAAGTQSKKGRKKPPKDFDGLYRGTLYKTSGGQYGIPATAFRAAMISACRLVNFKMTLAKLSIFICADGFDERDSTPLVFIRNMEPKKFEALVWNNAGMGKAVPDIRPRPLFESGWEALVKIRFDGDQFNAADVANLMMRVGIQLGIGAGRNDSKNSAGCGWGEFELVCSQTAAAD